MKKVFFLIVFVLAIKFALAQSFITQSIPSDGKSSINFRYFRLLDSDFQGTFNGIYDFSSTFVLNERWLLGGSFSYIRTADFSNERLERFYQRSELLPGPSPFKSYMFGNIGISAGYLLDKHKKSAIRLRLLLPLYSDGIPIIPASGYAGEANGYEMILYTPNSFNLTSTYSWELNNESNWLVGGEIGFQAFLGNEREENLYIHYALKFGHKFKLLTLFTELGGLTESFSPGVEDAFHFANLGIEINNSVIAPGLFFMTGIGGMGSQSVGLKLNYKF